MKTSLRLLQPHAHAGRECPPGALIEVDPDLADWLVTSGIARVLAGEPDIRTDSPPEPTAETGSLKPFKEKRP